MSAPPTRLVPHGANRQNGRRQDVKHVMRNGVGRKPGPSLARQRNAICVGRTVSPVTLPPTFIQRERDSGFEFCPIGRVGQRGLARSLSDCAASGPLRGEGSGKLGWGLPAEAGVGPFGVVVRAPGGERGAGMMQGREQGLVQEFVPQTAIEALDKGILGRLSGRDIVPVKLAIIHELQDRVRGELGPPPQENDPLDRFLIFVDH